MADVDRLGQACAGIAGLARFGGIQVAELGERDSVHRYSLEITRPDQCVRLIAVGDAGIAELDLLLRAPSGESLAGDVSHDSWPIVPTSSPGCFAVPGIYLLEVSVYRGAGKYALGIWTDGP
jgi:hypothetical protein